MLHWSTNQQHVSREGLLVDSSTLREENERLKESLADLDLQLSTALENEDSKTSVMVTCPD